MIKLLLIRPGLDPNQPAVGPHWEGLFPLFEAARQNSTSIFARFMERPDINVTQTALNGTNVLIEVGQLWSNSVLVQKPVPLL